MRPPTLTQSLTSLRNEVMQSLKPWDDSARMTEGAVWMNTVLTDAIFGLGEVRLVGSTLGRPGQRRSTPRDVDLVLILPDMDFERLFMPPDVWASEGVSGRWSDLRCRWSDVCVAWSKELRRRIGTKRMIDFKILPSSHRDHGKRSE